jgi:hypothetical protein
MTAANVQGLKTIPVMMMVSPTIAVMALTARLFMIKLDFFFNDFYGSHHGIWIYHYVYAAKFVGMILFVENDGV